MIFSSTIFLFGFMPIVILVNLLLNEKYRNIWLFLASLLFYAWAQPEYIWLILCTVLVDYLAGIIMERVKCRRFVLTSGIVLNLIALTYFKYFAWIAEMINNALDSDKISVPDLIMPLGISFFTFKGISYLADVYLKKTEACTNVLHMAVYLTMFPQIMSGPIDRYVDLKDQIRERKIDINDFNLGIERFIYGISKKVIIADSLGQIVDTIWSQGAGSSDWKVAWFGSIAYSLQLFFDFAGYTDMAVGLGKMLGFKFAENFDYPYFSKSITEFWRRWHMTLGTWFKYYIYIPLGGNRKRVYFNLFIVFLLTGIWHGAALTFVLWGVLHGVFRLLEKKLNIGQKKDEEKPGLIKSLLLRIYLLFTVNMLWVLFRAPALPAAVNYIKSMFGTMNVRASGLSLSYYLTRWNAFVFALALILCFPVVPFIGKKLRKINDTAVSICSKILLLVLLLFAIMRLVTSNYSAFIYFQF